MDQDQLSEGLDVGLTQPSNSGSGEPAGGASVVTDPCEPGKSGALNVGAVMSSQVDHSVSETAGSAAKVDQDSGSIQNENIKQGDHSTIQQEHQVNVTASTDHSNSLDQNESASLGRNQEVEAAGRAGDAGSNASQASQLRGFEFSSQPGNSSVPTKRLLPSDIAQICPPYAEDIAQTCPPSAADIAQTCPPSAADIAQTCPPSAADIAQTCPPSAADIAQTCPPYAADITRTCMPSIMGNAQTCPLPGADSAQSTSLFSVMQSPSSTSPGGGQSSNSSQPVPGQGVQEMGDRDGDVDLLEARLNIAQTCPPYAEDIAQTCPPSAADITQTCPPSAADITRTCMPSIMGNAQTCPLPGADSAQSTSLFSVMQSPSSTSPGGGQSSNSSQPVPGDQGSVGSGQGVQEMGDRDGDVDLLEARLRYLGVIPGKED